MFAYLIAALAGAWLLWRVWLRLELSLAKHPSIAGHARWSRRLARWVPYYEFDESRFFSADDAPVGVANKRRGGLARLAQDFAARHGRSAALAQSLGAGLADLDFTSRYRVPYPFGRLVREQLKCGIFVESAGDSRLRDIDGNDLYDLAGSYGVNLFGYDFYRQCIERGAARVRELGPVLGFLHPVVAENMRRLRQISGLDSVSFHMSGTEAVMQAVRLARYHTRRQKLVRFCGAYHGWWGDVQPGVGNPVDARDTLTLRDMSERALRVLERRSDVACVLVNPLQALHPNNSAPGDNALVDGGAAAGVDRAAYGAWLSALRAVCSRRGIVLIFDEVFVGFRLAPGGAQEYFNVRADLVTYGKSLGGGLPVGVVCGRAELMQRYRSDRPADVCLARGTFNSHPYVMGAMAEFLEFLITDEARKIYDGLDLRWDERAARLNARLQLANLPVRVANLSSIWTVCYLQPSRYNWMLQFYLRGQGLALSWVGTGRFIFRLDLPEHDFAAIVDKFCAAAVAMDQDGWFWCPEGASNRTVRRAIFKEMLHAR